MVEPSATKAQGRTPRPARLWNAAAVALALVTAALVLFLPLATTVTVTAVAEGSATGSSTPPAESTTSTSSLYASEGFGVLAVALVPVLLAAVPLVTRRPAAERRVRLACTALLGVAVMLGALSIGLFFVPVLVLMIVALAATPASAPAC